MKAWNEWRLANPHEKPNLIGADLRKADLRKADLTGAYLSTADLSGATLSMATLSMATLTWAKLNGADLSKAYLVRARFDHADLQYAILSDVELGGSSLISANLSRADISGARMKDVNTSRWIIKGIKCTHIFRDDKRIDYAESEFEKAYTQIESIVEMIIDAPFSELTYHIGRFIENAVNKRFGEGALMLKTQAALSKDVTKYEYVSFKEEDELHEIINILTILQKELKPVIEDAKSKNEPKPVFNIKEKID